MNLLTTTQVRNIMQANGVKLMYTNKSAGNPGNIRRVKAYYHGNLAMLTALQEACGKENVNLTKGSNSPRSFGHPAVTVRCVLG